MKKSELEILEEKVKQLKAKQARCNHEWLEPYKDTFQKEITRIEIHHAGVDIWPYEYHTGEYETIPCYARECKICGKIERTTEMEDVVVKTIRAPKFQ